MDARVNVSFSSVKLFAAQRRNVSKIIYEAFETLALKNLNHICERNLKRFGLHSVYLVHRTGELSIEDLVIFVATSAAHRKEAFLGCETIIDELKHECPHLEKRILRRWEPRMGTLPACDQPH